MLRLGSSPERIKNVADVYLLHEHRDSLIEQGIIGKENVADVTALVASLLLAICIL